MQTLTGGSWPAGPRQQNQSRIKAGNGNAREADNDRDFLPELSSAENAAYRPRRHLESIKGYFTSLQLFDG